MSRTLKRFEELGRCRIGENKFLVVSQATDGVISIAQQVRSESDGDVYEMFLKNAIRCQPEMVDQIIDMLQQAKQQFS